jgi:hypothetical protein
MKNWKWGVIHKVTALHCYTLVTLNVGFWDGIPCSPKDDTIVSYKCVASILSVGNSNGESMFVWYIDNLPTRLHGLILQKILFLKSTAIRISNLNCMIVFEVIKMLNCQWRYQSLSTTLFLMFLIYCVSMSAVQ